MRDRLSSAWNWIEHKPLVGYPFFGLVTLFGIAVIIAALMLIDYPFVRWGCSIRASDAGVAFRQPFMGNCELEVSPGNFVPSADFSPTPIPGD